MIAEGDMPNSATPEGCERLSALKAAEAKLRRFCGLAFAADSIEMIAIGNPINSVSAFCSFMAFHFA